MSSYIWNDICETWDTDCILWEQCDTILEYLWNDTCETWDTDCILWEQCDRILEKITGGAARTPEEVWDAYKTSK